MCQVIFAVTKAGNVRPDSLPESTGADPLPVPWLPACALGHCWGSGRARGQPRLPQHKDSLQLWSQARSQPVALTRPSFRSMVKHLYQLESHEFSYPAFHYENLQFLFFFIVAARWVSGSLFTQAPRPRLYGTTRPTSLVSAGSHLQMRITQQLITFYWRWVNKGPKTQSIMSHKLKVRWGS